MAPRRPAKKRAPAKSVALKKRFSVTEEILLIETVRNFPLFWRRTDADYMNKDLKPLKWKQVGDIEEISPEDCKNKWNALYGTYRRSCGPMKSGDAADKSPWKHAERMSFLRQFIKKRKGEGNFTQIEDKEDSEGADSAAESGI